MKPFDIPLVKPNPNSPNFRCGFLNEYLQSQDEHNQYFLAQLPTIHRLDLYLWFFCLDGQFVHMLDCEKITLNAGQAILIRPHQVHQVLNMQGNGFFIAWRDEFLLKNVDSRALPSVQIFNHADNADLQGFCQLFQSGFSFQDLSIKIPFLQAQLTSFLYYLNQKFAQNQQPQTIAEKRFFAFTELLEQHFLQQKQVQFYAHALNCSAKTLNIACQQQTGNCVKTLIEKRVLLESKRLLVHSQLSINAIANELGFIDGTQFAKFFRKYENRTANAFRQKFSIG